MCLMTEEIAESIVSISLLFRTFHFLAVNCPGRLLRKHVVMELIAENNALKICIALTAVNIQPT